jgi:hypothetical protein
LTVALQSQPEETITLGLAERRATQDYQAGVYPGLKKQIDDAAGFEVPMQIDWQAMAEPNRSILYEEFWTKIYFQPLIQALQQIGGDDLGKAALKDGLKQVDIANTKEYCDSAGISFQNGVLKIDQELMNADHARERVAKIVKLLEASL